MVPSTSLSPDCDTIQRDINRNDVEAYPVNSVTISGVDDPTLRVIGIACIQAGVVRTNIILLIRDCNAFLLGWHVDATCVASGW